jgi:hypothetical protein
LKVDPTSLAVLARFTLPAPPLLVAVARGGVWVATPTGLVRVSPTSGVVVATVALGFSPVALAPSFDGGRIRARGGPVGIEDGAMASYGTSTYWLHDVATTDSLLQIAPSPSCFGS